MNAEDKRANALRLIEDHIGRSIAESEASGELQRARGYGQPLDFGDGYDETPPELRMAMKVLKDAGVVPPEVELMQRLAALRQAAEAASDPAERQRLQQQASELQQALSLRLERLRSGAV